ncbi:MAG: 16S rRNA (cytosine(1402)-N(4))-methyltransferase RsmH [Acidobacteriota bacterium]
MQATDSKHIPVLLHESLELLGVKPGGVYVDCTLGLGGHAAAILQRLGGKGRLIALDRDRESLDRARAALGDQAGNVSFHHENFRNLPLVLHHLGVAEVDGILLDLGVSRWQLTDPERGFTFQEEGPLDMRMDRTQATTAADLVNQLSPEELTELFRQYGEEPEARRIAAAIVAERKRSRIRTTRQLARLVAEAKHRRTLHHPATRVFQALRIAVNQELEGLDTFLAKAVDFLAPGGRLVAISFHSLEDRIVKRALQLAAGKCICRRPGDLCRCPRVPQIRVLTKKPVTPGPEELAVNPSARSAKLRAAEKLSEAGGSRHDGSE